MLPDVMRLLSLALWLGFLAQLLAPSAAECNGRIIYPIGEGIDAWEQGGPFAVYFYVDYNECDVPVTHYGWVSGG